MSVNYPFLKELLVTTINQISEITNAIAKFITHVDFPNLFVFVFSIIVGFGLLKVLKII